MDIAPSDRSPFADVFDITPTAEVGHEAAQPMALSPSMNFPLSGNRGLCTPGMGMTPTMYTPGKVAMQLDQQPVVKVAELQNMMMQFMSELSNRVVYLENFVFGLSKLVAEKRNCGNNVFGKLNSLADSPSSLARPTGDQATNPIQNQRSLVNNKQLPQRDKSSSPSVEAISNGRGGESPDPMFGNGVAAGSGAASAAGMASAEVFDYRLELSGVKSEYFSERHFPPFVVRLIDNRTGEIVRQATDWCVFFHLIDGYGHYVDEKLDNEKTRRQYLIHGQTEVNGLKFKQVSSKNGGHFVLEAELIDPVERGRTVQKCKSGNITILSCRLFQCRKGSLSRLEPSEAISKLPGIGKQYAQRLCENGYRTIEDLAAIPLDDLSQLYHLLSEVRREKGTLTEAKLIEYVRQAKNIVSSSGKRGRDDEGITEEKDDGKRLRVDEMSVFATGFDDGNFVADPNNMLTLINESFLETSSPTLWPQEEDGAGARLAYNDGFSVRGTSADGSSRAIARVFLSPTTSVSPLLLAIACRNVGLVTYVVQRLAEKNIPVDSVEGFPVSGLMFACALGDAAIVDYLSSLPNVGADQARGDGWTAMHFAVLGGNIACVQALLRVVKPFARTSTGWTPLMLAVARKDVNVVSVLLKSFNKFSKEITDCDVNGFGIFHLAAMSGSVEVMKLLHQSAPLSLSAVIAHGHSPKIPSPLHCATFSGNAALVQLLLDLGAATDVIYEDGWSPLHVAAAVRSAGSVRALLQASPTSVNATTVSGWSPLSVCSMSYPSQEHGKVDQAADADGSDEEADEATAACIAELVKAGATDQGSKIPASVVSVVCSNMSALMALHEEEGIQQTVKLLGQNVDFVSMSKQVGNDDMIDLLEAMMTV